MASVASEIVQLPRKSGATHSWIPYQSCALNLLDSDIEAQPLRACVRIAAALRRRSGFPRFAGPLVVGFPPVLSQRGWEHDGFQWVLLRQDALALEEAAPDLRNNAHLVLHTIIDLDWRSGR